MMIPHPVLISWIAVNNDPYEQNFKIYEKNQNSNHHIHGPTLTILYDKDSPYFGKFLDVVLLYRNSNDNNSKESRSLSETIAVLKQCDAKLRIHLEPWNGNDPTDHSGIFEFIRQVLPRIRKQFVGHELVIHISPGTPSMQTIWVLMAETGFIEAPFKIVKSYRKNERHGRLPVVPVALGLETFYKVYRASRPSQIACDEQAVVWDPGKFQTSTMRQLFTEARRFAYFNVPVLILGERGTGKTTLAGWMRLHSPFRREDQDAHWPAVACGQYSPETMRSELFGYKKGSFTGATNDKDGLLIAANGDTLFLDEVGDVSRDLQRLLIKALEEKRFFPIGDERPRKSNFRLLTATNIEWSELERRLDPDFLDRISLMTLRLPPLREIRDEIPWLWETVFDQAAHRSGVGKRQAQLGVVHHRRIVASLMQHQLPGNLRDLFRVAYRILTARSDPHEPLAAEDAVDYGVQCLDDGSRWGGITMKRSRMVALAFAEARPLDSLLIPEEIVKIKTIERDLKAYLAEELRRIAKKRNVSAEKLCDVSERALRKWTKE